jgi:DNA-binding MarR family transcriptional regulator
VAGKILEELQQKRAFTGPEAEAFLNVVRTASMLSHASGELLKPHELTHTQYNVLRILRGAGEKGLNAGDVAARMISRDPDVTRLLDRLEARGLAERWRCAEDRRVVWTRITPAGRRVTDALDAPMEALHREQFGHLGAERLAMLIELLEEVRAEVGG